MLPRDTSRAGGPPGPLHRATQLRQAASRSAGLRTTSVRTPSARPAGQTASRGAAAALGGPRSRHELEREMPEIPERRPGLFVIDLDGTMIGMVELKRHGAEGAGHVRSNVGKSELGYLFLPGAWGRGYGTEACAAALGWFAHARPGEPVVLYTQTANDRSMRLAAKRCAWCWHRPRPKSWIPLSPCGQDTEPSTWIWSMR
ncbi:GNAT family N-acetyltransferase [Streptomyces sp. NPDC051320]|uniref:GNAT family N-acetyltransferase n=1 Tax=Streptomyces sp. NPDC051320 TaxID=3154644 RepID=UPI00342463E5